MKRLELVSKRSKKAFSLIEVIISVLIISIVGLALLEIANKNTKLMGFLENKREVPSILSFISFHGNPDIDNLEKNLYDIVEKDYKIESDRLKKYLESKTVLYKEEVVDRVDFGTAEETKDENEIESADSAEGVLTQQIEIYKQTIKTKELIGKVYSIRVEE